MVQARWAMAARDAGRVREATAALERASSVFSERGEFASAAEALIALSLTIQYGGADRSEIATVEEAVSLAERAGSSAVLVEALSRLATLLWLRADYDSALATAQSAVELAEESGGSSAVARSCRGLVRCELGDRGGVSDIEEALAELIAEGRGREAAMLQNNLGYARWAYEGPRIALGVFAGGADFATRRGITSIAQVTASSRLSALVELGLLHDAVAGADELFAAHEGDQNLLEYGSASASRARALAELGRTEEARGSAEIALTTARQLDRLDEFVNAALAGSIVYIDVASFREARQLLDEVLQLPNVKACAEYPYRVPALVRAALATGDSRLARTFAEGVDAVLPIGAHALATASALLAEADGERVAAAERFADAASRWKTFEGRLEQAYALLGRGRCLSEVGGAGADAPLLEARVLFSEMGARPCVAECDALIARASAIGS